MIRFLSNSVILVCAAAGLGWAQLTPEKMTAGELSDQAGALARSGSAVQALRLYETALAQEPGNTEIRADYATVLGWAERYPQSIAEFRRVFIQDPKAADWVLQEFARSQLFGDFPAAALDTLNELARRGDNSEATLCRIGLALRWMNRPKDAEKAYRQALDAHPQSVTAQIGRIYSLAGQNQLGRALETVRDAHGSNPDKWQFVKVESQLLNWMGRHRDASKVLAAISQADDRELIESRIAAARWGGRPGEAKRAVMALAKTYPGVPAAEKLRSEVSLEYGKMVATSFRIASDSDGLTDRLFEEVFAIHAGPGNRVQFGLEQRALSMEQPLGWRRASVSWSSELSSRLSGYTSFSQVKYRSSESGRSPFFGDGALTYAVSDRIRISGGGGSAAADAFRAIENRVTSNFYYGEIALQPTTGISLSGRYMRSIFSDSVVRERAEVEGFVRVYTGSKFRFDAGGSGNRMSHSRQTADFFSPESFYSVLGKVRLSGRLSRRIEYTAQIGAGFQQETGFALQSPLVATVSIFARLNRHLLLQVDAGRSTSSLERINPGRESYARSVLAAGLVYRFE